MKCNVCNKTVKRDYFGNVFETCGPCVANLWLEGFVANRTKGTPVAKLPKWNERRDT